MSKHKNCDGRVSALDKYNDALKMLREAYGPRMVVVGIDGLRETLRAVTPYGRKDAIFDAGRFLVLSEVFDRVEIFRDEDLAHRTSETTDTDMFAFDLSEREAAKDPEVIEVGTVVVGGADGSPIIGKVRTARKQIVYTILDHEGFEYVFADNHVKTIDDLFA